MFGQPLLQLAGSEEHITGQHGYAFTDQARRTEHDWYSLLQVAKFAVEMLLFQHGLYMMAWVPFVAEVIYQHEHIYIRFCIDLHQCVVVALVKVGSTKGLASDGAYLYTFIFWQVQEAFRAAAYLVEDASGNVHEQLAMLRRQLILPAPLVQPPSQRAFTWQGGMVQRQRSLKLLLRHPGQCDVEQALPFFLQRKDFAAEFAANGLQGCDLLCQEGGPARFKVLRWQRADQGYCCSHQVGCGRFWLGLYRRNPLCWSVVAIYVG